MASQLQALSASTQASPSAFGAPAPLRRLPSCSTTTARCTLKPSAFVQGPRLRIQPGLRPSSRTLPPCIASKLSNSSHETKNGGERQRNVLADVWAKAPEPIRVFPWAKAGRLFLERLFQQFWIVGKWLAIPVLAVSMLSEVSYTLVQEKVLLIPAGMIGGIAFCGIMKETALELSAGIDKSEVPWHLVALGLFFSVLKYIGPYLPVWGRVTIPHFANGGLWQTIKLVNDWRKEHARRTTVEQN